MQLYQQAWKAIISPPQMKGRLKNYGPNQRVIEGQKIFREDFRITNKNNKSIVGFYFHCPQLKATQTILYLHGNGGSKYQALPLIENIPKFKINIAAFDFLGCGNSDSSYLTYGIKEAEDVHLIISQINKRFGKQKITLWGRSMGAQCAIMYVHKYPNNISGMILDSPFQKLEDVIDRIAKKQVSLPEILMKPVLYMIKNKASQQTSEDLFGVDYLEIFKKMPSGLPVLFIYSHFDKIVPTQQVVKFYKAYKGPKDLCEIFQNHDQDRPKKVFSEAISWVMRTRRNMTQKFVSEQVLKQWQKNDKSTIDAFNYGRNSFVSQK